MLSVDYQALAMEVLSVPLSGNYRILTWWIPGRSKLVEGAPPGLAYVRRTSAPASTLSGQAGPASAAADPFEGRVLVSLSSSRGALA